MSAVLLLEDGTVFKGTSFGAKGHRCGEVVFNTAMTGYQEILTDPSYSEQIVTMTYPLIGNYGINGQDCESKQIFAAGFVVKEYCPFPSNWRNTKSLSKYLIENNIIAIEGIDTRKLVKHIRTQGAMKGIIASDDSDMKTLAEKLAKYPGLLGRDIVKDVTSSKSYKWDKGVTDILTGIEHKPTCKYKVAALDCGIKHNILRLLRSYACEVTVFGADTPPGDILDTNPDGLFLSNGPGDPAPVEYAIKTTRALLGKLPIFGICLGHQILGLALGGTTYKLKFGHHGANHPVKNLKTGSIEITSQNHGFCVDIDSLAHQPVEPTHINLNDNTCEGIKSEKLKAFSVQYHPEAAPGPHESRYLFKQFTQLMDANKH